MTEPAPELCACGCGAPVTAWRLGARCAHLLAGMCLGKKRWTERYAAKVLAQVGDSKEAYKCGVCGQWHTGTSLGERGEQINAERREVIVRLRRSGAGWLLTYLAGVFETAERRQWKAREWKADRS